MKYTVTLLITILTLTLQAQKIKVDWTFTSKKIKEGIYELHLTAKVPKGWHLYSQYTGEGPVATAFKFNTNALATLTGKVKELGKLVTVDDVVWKNKQKFFYNTVDFVQQVQLKTKIKTNVSGEVEYMICDDNQCLPPTTQKYSITL